MYISIEKLTNSKKKNIQLVGGDFNAGSRPGHRVERASVGPHTLKEGNKRGDWMKQWLMMPNLIAHNTMYRKTLDLQDTKRYRETVGLHVGGQETYLLQQRRQSKRHDPHGTRPQKSCGTICHNSTKEKVLQKTHHDKMKMKMKENTKTQSDDKTRLGEAIKFEERIVELERKLKHKAEFAATTQNQEMTESLKNIEASGRSCRCWCHNITSLEGGHKRCSKSGDEIGKSGS